MRDDNEAFVKEGDAASKRMGMRKPGFKKKVCKFCGLQESRHASQIHHREG